MGDYNETGTPQFVTLGAGTYDIVAYGAQGGDAAFFMFSDKGGLGAEIGGQFALTQTETLELIVGGQGASDGDGGGGGGSFVLEGDGASYRPLLIAGGGGGAGLTTNGGPGTVASPGNGSGGTSGGGAGVKSDGTASPPFDGGLVPTSGDGGYNGTGGYAGGKVGGGFGGGGGSSSFHSNFTSGGGGGYTGGNGGQGGTSFDAGTPIAGDAIAGERTGNGLIVITQVLCFLRGTRIATPAGPVAIESLRVGDPVIARRDGAETHEPVVWIGRRFVDARTHPRPDRVWPVRIAAGALGDGLPHRPLLVSPDHALLLDGVLIAARQLVNGVTITIEHGGPLEYFHVELARHAILLAEGAPAESYLDTGNRHQFDNGGPAIALHADFARADHPDACAPLTTDAAVVQPIWARLAALGGEPVPPAATTRDADLSLLLPDGRTVRPARVEADGLHVFFLRADQGGIARLRSRHAAPADVRPWLDDRRQLGVAIDSIAIWTAQGGFAADTPALETFDDGWWPVEAEAGRRWRWTDGDAALVLPPGCRRLAVGVRAAAEILAQQKHHFRRT